MGANTTTAVVADWTKPQPVSDLDMAFGGNAMRLMPEYKDIPEEFRRDRNPWCQWQAEWFFKGLPSFPAAKPGIDAAMAARHLKTIQHSFEPKHEHKQAGVAYLASLWLVAPWGPTS